jgi:hypothetical protein
MGAFDVIYTALNTAIRSSAVGARVLRRRDFEGPTPPTRGIGWPADKSRVHRSISRVFTRCARMHAMDEDDEKAHVG